MKRQIRLTETQLHNIIVESVNRILNEGIEYDDHGDMDDVIENDNMSESIEIKPENKGKFNATKKRTGKSTEELLHSKNPLTRKRANFAKNSKKWKH